MLDTVSLDQLRAFVAAVDEGSFSAAGRKLRRAQSAISAAIGTLEEQLGVTVFDRSGRYPTLTAEGVLLLADARGVLGGVTTLKARARSMAEGLETELSVVVDVFFPTKAISATAKAFARQFPLIPLRLFVEGLGAAYQPVLSGRCSLGILGALPLTFPGLSARRLGEIPLVPVAAPGHPLARIGRPLKRADTIDCVQLVLTDRSDLMAGQDHGVLSPTTWRLGDLSTKRAFLKDGLGWGTMPLHMVEADLRRGTLQTLDFDEQALRDIKLSISVFHPTSRPPGPAGQWFIDHIAGTSP